MGLGVRKARVFWELAARNVQELDQLEAWESGYRHRGQNAAEENVAISGISGELVRSLSPLLSR